MAAVQRRASRVRRATTARLALRRRCLANYPSIEYSPHERLQQNGLSLAGASARWDKIATHYSLAPYPLTPSLR